MSSNLYELISLGARYLFAAIMVVIVIRAWKITIVDSRRANHLRRLSPETGVCGEFLVLSGSGRVRDGMRFPVIREGMIGSSRKADIRLRCPGIHRTHAFFELTESGLRIRTRGGSHMYNARGESKKDIILVDGSRVTFAQTEFMLILTVAVNGEAAPEERDTIFDLPDDSFDTAPRIRREQPRPVVSEGFDDFDAYCEDTETAVEPSNDIPSQPAPEENPHPIFTNVPDTDDLFMEDIPTDLRPASDDPWDDTEDAKPVKIWDDWEDTPAKTRVKRKKYDDPFDV